MAFDIKTALTSIAPTLATMLGGPLAGTAVAALESALGLQPGSGPDAVTSAMSAGMTPDAIASVRKADQEHAEKLRSMDIDVLRLNADHERAMAEVAAANQDSARKANVSGGVQMPLFFLSLFLLATGLGSEGYVLFNGVPDNVHDIVVGRVLGLMDAVVMMVLGYWYGTTNGSSQKNDLLAQAQPAKP
jgi:hypothetical protein